MAQAVDKTGPAAERADAGQAVTATPAEPSSAGPPAGPRAAAGPADGHPDIRVHAAAQPRLRAWFRRRPRDVAPKPPALPDGTVLEPGIELPEDDPLAGYLMKVSGTVDIRELEFDSPALSALKAAGAVLVVPLISAGAPIGLLSLGPRLSEREYTAADRHLLNALAGYAAPAVRVGQLVREQREEARERERIEQELKVARLVQQQFLPQALPDMPGWQVAMFYRPARTVGGDFYDFIPLPGGQAMVVVGDVTGKGVPAAMVMASTHALMRAAAPRLISPGAVLGRVNELLFTDTPAHMFVTCLALLLDAGTGRVTFANAGHDVPYVRTADGVAELRARGMPLGLMPGMTYEEKAFTFRPDDCALLYSDGLSEAHGAGRQMFGFGRVAALVGGGASGQALIDLCLTELDAFTGPGYEQEDDITLLSLVRAAAADSGEAP
jgi:serine phosphatase RsbU (regulator of sigma subunit)